MTITFEWALTLCVGIFLVGSIISVLTKFRVPTMLTTAVIFLIGFWTVFPQDLIQISGLKVIYDICFLVVLIHIGAMFEWEALKKDWKIAVVAITAVLVIALLVTPIGSILFGKDIAICSVPPPCRRRYRGNHDDGCRKRKGCHTSCIAVNDDYDVANVHRFPADRYDTAKRSSQKTERRALCRS